MLKSKKMKFDFYKYQALGNDYIVIDPNYFKINLSKNLIKKICDRNFGIGSDGILYGPFWNKPSCQNFGVGIKIFNPDGSEAEKSGNDEVKILVQKSLVSPEIKDIDFGTTVKGHELVRLKIATQWLYGLNDFL